MPGILGMILLSCSFRSMTSESRIPWFPDTIGDSGESGVRGVGDGGDGGILGGEGDGGVLGGGVLGDGGGGGELIIGLLSCRLPGVSSLSRPKLAAG